MLISYGPCAACIIDILEQDLKELGLIMPGRDIVTKQNPGSNCHTEYPELESMLIASMMHAEQSPENFEKIEMETAETAKQYFEAHGIRIFNTEPEYWKQSEQDSKYNLYHLIGACMEDS